MNPPTRDDLLEATRLTRAGRLSEATDLLQRTLRGGATPAPEPRTRHGRGEDAGRREAGGGGGLGATLRNALGGLLAKVRPAAATGAADTDAAPASTGRPRGERWLRATFAVGGDSRDYRLYVPSSYRGQPVPLVIMLHGCTQSPEDFATGTRMNEAAEARTLLVAYPEQSAQANQSRCWNWFSPADQQRGRGEPALIAGIVQEVTRGYAVDPGRVYIAGLSAGGAAAAASAAAYPDLFAAVGVHSGLGCGAAHDMPSAFAAMRNGAAPGGRLPVPAIVFHGDQDATVHPSNGEQVLAQARAAASGALRPERQTGRAPGGHAYSRTRYLDASERAVAEQWVVHGGGHAWSGGSAAGTYADPRGPDATGAMLDFFLTHRAPATAEAERA
jgi:poly(hydroxyalkanoate) depolymerase family esterase